MSLLPCPSCARHVRAPSTECPFCGVAIASRSAVPVRRVRRSRAVRILGVAAIGVACGGTTTPSDGGVTDGSTDAIDDTAPLPMYGGGPFPDGGVDATSNDAASDAADASDADADSSGIALYGAPPPPDGG